VAPSGLTVKLETESLKFPNHLSISKAR
jgi:hypothetical protein